MNTETIFKFPLDTFQKEACEAISRGQNVLVCAKTGSGKTLVGEYQIHKALAEGSRVFYTTPIKSLSNQKFHDLKAQFSNVQVGILTGDIKFCPDAQIVVMTTEILRNLLYKVGTETENLGLTSNLTLQGLSAVIFDECHYMNDPERGHVWEEIFILLPPHIQMVLLSATLDHPEFLAEWLSEIKGPGHPTVLIQADYRVVPLNHCVLFPSEKEGDFGYRLEALMCSTTGKKEVFSDKMYENWLKVRRNNPLQRAEAKAERQVVAAAQLGTSVSSEQSLRPHSFQHNMNAVLEFLKMRNLLPALFFVLSRNNCERYANLVQSDFLDTHEISSVRSIVGFHLSRHMDILEKMPQWIQLYKLLQRGIAYHHSGLIPQIKEIIELLFSRGLVRLLFCTETFAVGLNMPTKTTLFAGFQKYDDTREQMRILRTDEYLQMAGRAGRRGKDTEGWAIYLPDREPISTTEMRRMMTGGYQILESRIELSYDLILKTMLSGKTLITEILKKSYWYRLRLDKIKQNNSEIDELDVKIVSAGIDDVTEKELAERLTAEQSIRCTTNASRKEAQRRLETWKNRHMGPRWEKAWKSWGDVLTWREKINQLRLENKDLLDLNTIVSGRIEWLVKEGYVEYTETDLTKPVLTKKGLMSTECNESCPLILPDFYLSISNEIQQEFVKNPNILIILLSAFLEPIYKENAADIGHIRSNISQSNVPPIVKSLSNILLSLKERLQDLEGISQRSIQITGDWMELLWIWLEDGVDPSILCTKHEVFEGNFVRSVMKLGNILDEWLSLASLCGDTTQIETVAGLRTKLGRDFIIQDSLYLRLG